MYLDGEQLRGGYTIRVLYAEASPDERAALEAQTGMVVPPVDF